jgi:antitoxin PrlF
LTVLYVPYYNVRNIRSRKESILAAATVTSKGQITIPVRVRIALGIDAGDRVEFVEVEKGQFALIAATRSVREMKGLFRGKRSKPVSVEEMNAAIAGRAAGSRRRDRG